jgi:hypothetical protein
MAQSMKTPRIFLSYRRSDSADVAGRIYDRLVQAFGGDAVFKDVDSVPLGIAFRKHIETSLARTHVVLVVIGPTWTSARNEQGETRILLENDLVRLEVETALALEVPVIPLLVGGATMPSPGEMPESILELRARNGMCVRPDPDFHSDMNRLISRIGADGTRAAETQTSPVKEAPRQFLQMLASLSHKKTFWEAISCFALGIYLTISGLHALALGGFLDSLSGLFSLVGGLILNILGRYKWYRFKKLTKAAPKDSNSNS